jgi:aminoglycoside 6'-N-acetyltransferase I
MVERATASHLDGWAVLRAQLWPRQSVSEHRDDAAAWMAENVCFIAMAGSEPIGFAEVALRSDYVAGCSTSPVAFLEGIYVVEPWRRRGVARQLCLAAEQWALAQGCSEFASDADIANLTSHRAHTALGFAEVERVVFFRKPLERR